MIEMVDWSKQKVEQQPRVGKFSQGLLNTDSILSALGIKPGQTVLDAGCGNGYMSKLFAHQVGPTGKVYALDTNSHYIEALGRETRGSNIHAIEGGITKPTTLAESFMDLI